MRGARRPPGALQRFETSIYKKGNGHARMSESPECDQNPASPLLQVRYSQHMSWLGRLAATRVDPPLARLDSSETLTVGAHRTRIARRDTGTKLRPKSVKCQRCLSMCLSLSVSEIASRIPDNIGVQSALQPVVWHEAPGARRLRQKRPSMWRFVGEAIHALRFSRSCAKPIAYKPYTTSKPEENRLPKDNM